MSAARLLTIIALGGAIVSAACLGGGYALATANDSRSVETIERELPWSGTQLIVAMPANVRYVQALGPARLIARGQHRSVSTLKVDDGGVSDQLLHTGAPIELTLIAPDVSSFVLSGASRLSIENYDQPALNLHIEGAGSVEAQGSAGVVSITAAGGATINLARLSVGSLHAALSGSSALVAAPIESADIDAQNSAIAVLASRPAHGSRRISGSARIIDASGGP